VRFSCNDNFEGYKGRDRKATTGLITCCDYEGGNCVYLLWYDTRLKVQDA